MPVYEYKCGDCTHRFELRCGFNDEPEASCPECKGKARRVFSPACVVFKGAGFYITDSREGSPESAGPKTGAT